jgi:hypothetical protein
MRNCRRCGAVFQPKKEFYFWCSMTCRRAALVEAEARPFSADDVARAYQAGLAEGLRRARSPLRGPEPLPLEAYRFMITLLHPDKHAGTSLEPLATRAVQWLNAHKPEA